MVAAALRELMRFCCRVDEDLRRHKKVKSVTTGHKLVQTAATILTFIQQQMQI